MWSHRKNKVQSIGLQEEAGLVNTIIGRTRVGVWGHRGKRLLYSVIGRTRCSLRSQEMKW